MLGGIAVDTEHEDPVLFGPSQLITSTKLSRSVGSYLDKAQKKPVFITRENEVEAVLISIEDYRELLLEEKKIEEIYLVLKAIRRFFEYKESGEPMLDMDDVLSKYGLSREALAEVMDDDKVEN